MTYDKIKEIESDLRLVETCGACPEQYEVYLGKKEVAYLRLRHGVFRVDVPFGKTVYTAHPNGDGCFDDDERDIWLSEAKRRIAVHLVLEDGE